MARLLLAFALVFAGAQERPITWRGSFAATVGPRTLQGTWTAQPLPGQPNAAQGSWTLVNGAGQATARGTWSAAKAERGWTGAWQARVAGRAAILSGTWRADVEGLDGAAISDLFAKAAAQDVSGAWASGPLSGAWTIRGRR